MSRSRRLALTALAASFAAILAIASPAAQVVRPPAVPLITHDPYFSVWSMADRLTDEWPKHWTGKPNGMMALLLVDGKPFRLMGAEWRRVPALAQTSLSLTPTRSIYTFAGAGIEATLTFLSPLLIDDLDILSRPVSYVTIDIRSADGAEHAVSLYYDACAELAVNSADQKVIWTRAAVDDLDVLSFGSRDQSVLERKGDDLRIDWGFFYLAAPRQSGLSSSIASDRTSRGAFVSTGRVPARDDLRMPRPVADGYPVAALSFDLGKVGAAPASRWLMLAYDDQFSIEYFYRKLRPYWRRDGWEAADLLAAAAKDHPALVERCRAFDEKLMAEMKTSGGDKYVPLAVLAYRQSLAAHKLAADYGGEPLFFSKENFSNGCIATVDVIYPAAPMYLLLNTALVRAMLTPVFEYAGGPEWKFPFAPHDLGTYPKADGQVYGGGSRSEENQMPVEESGNMIILTAAVAKLEGKADYALKYWPQIERWATYLKDKGLDPENQLCTDDFAGHLAHNANLSIKAILGLRSYALLCEMAGKKADAAAYKKLSEDFARKWATMADDGDHYRLAFDKPGTWSQKYNLVWDRILGTNLFPAEIARKEMAFYKKNQLQYGLPLDSRRTYTKLDWVLWTATLAETPADFAALLDPVYDWLNATPTRVPLTDWYFTDSGKMAGFQARSVVGGVLIKMLADKTAKK